MSTFNVEYPGESENIDMGAHGHDYTSNNSLIDRQLTGIQNIGSGVATVSYKVNCRNGVTLTHTGVSMPIGDQVVGSIFDFQVTAGGPVRCYFQRNQAE